MDIKTEQKLITVAEVEVKNDGAYLKIQDQDKWWFSVWPSKNMSATDKQAYFNLFSKGNTIVVNWLPTVDGKYKNIKSADVNTLTKAGTQPSGEPIPQAPQAKSSPVTAERIQSSTPDNRIASIAVSYAKDLMVAGLVKPETKLYLKVMAWITNNVTDALDEATNSYIDQVGK